jgi:hypothetical protein
MQDVQKCALCPGSIPGRWEIDFPGIETFDAENRPHEIRIGQRLIRQIREMSVRPSLRGLHQRSRRWSKNSVRSEARPPRVSVVSLQRTPHYPPLPAAEPSWDSLLGRLSERKVPFWARCCHGRAHSPYHQACEMGSISPHDSLDRFVGRVMMELEALAIF